MTRLKLMMDYTLYLVTMIKQFARTATVAKQNAKMANAKMQLVEKQLAQMATVATRNALTVPVPI
jgi:hypothetical protein